MIIQKAKFIFFKVSEIRALPSTLVISTVAWCDTKDINKLGALGEDFQKPKIC